MKTLIKLFLAFLVIGIVSCRDTKKEEQELNAAIEEVESIESEVEKISEDLEKETEELKNELEELDNI